MKKILLVILIILAAGVLYHLFSSGSQPHSQTEPDNFSFTYELTECFGQCPTFKFEVGSDGVFVYEGIRYVDFEGVIEGQLSEGQLNDVRETVDKLNYFSLKERYFDSRLSNDGQSIITTVVIGTKEHSVIDREYGPDKLHDLYDLFDEIILEIIN